MEIILTILSGLFITAVLLLAAFFGFTILAIILATGALAAVLTVGVSMLRRWKFIKSANEYQKSGPTVIEGEYKDISQDKEKL